jgi:hypothetical protein
MKHRAALAPAILAAAALAAGGSASARAGTNVDLTIKTVSETKSQYKGKIKSDDPNCVADRLIKVKSRQTRLVKTRSDEDGKFDEIGKRPESGDPLKLKVVAKDDCDALIETGTAE